MPKYVIRRYIIEEAVFEAPSAEEALRIAQEEWTDESTPQDDKFEVLGTVE